MNNIVIIGGGIAGYTAALQLASKENNVTLIEKNILGGTCLNVGCIPIKLLNNLSLSTKNHDIIFKEKDKTIHNLRSSIASLISMKKITYITDEAKITNNNTVKLIKTNKTIPFDILILAIGSHSVVPKKLNQKNVLTPNKLMQIKDVPKKLAIIGGGYLGIELAYTFHNLNARVVIIEKGQRILPEIPQSASDILAERLKEKGVEILTDVEITNCSDKKLLLSDKSSIDFDISIITFGKKANIIESDLPLTYVNGFIQTDDYFSTNHKNIYAIGDCTDGPLLAHRAEYDARLLAQNLISGVKKNKEYENIPRIVNANPTIAHIGISEGIRKIRMDFANIGTSYCDNSTKGFLELYIDDDKKIYGGLVVNKNAHEILSALTPIVYGKMSCIQVAQMIWAHPTPSEIIKEAAKKAL